MKIFVVFLSLLLLFGCSSTEKMTVSEEPRQENPYDESFDPAALNDDDIVVHKFDNTASSSAPSGQNQQNNEQNVSYSEVKGFRVQIIATKNIETATLAEQEAKELFESMNQKTYLIFEAPLYKLRVGDVISRDEAEEIRDVAKDYGYREAFIVPTKVNVAR